MAAWRWPLAIAGIGLIALPVIYFTEDADSADEPMVKVTVPQLSGAAIAGEKPFNDNCLACHGANAGGTKKGPPLIHRLYEPSHHPDAAFRRAAKYGVQAHHWKSGNMPRVEVSDDELASIIVYVRELQRANGIQ
jgi:mono/diheme cytochrome c family protein